MLRTLHASSTIWFTMLVTARLLRYPAHRWLTVQMRLRISWTYCVDPLNGLSFQSVRFQVGTKSVWPLYCVRFPMSIRLSLWPWRSIFCWHAILHTSEVSTMKKVTELQFSMWRTFPLHPLHPTGWIPGQPSFRPILVELNLHWTECLLKSLTHCLPTTTSLQPCSWTDFKWKTPSCSNDAFKD